MHGESGGYTRWIDYKNMAKKHEMPSDEKAQLLLETVEDRLAIDPILLDLRGKTLMTDFFLVCSGNSDVHIRAIADAVLEKSGEERLSKPRIEGQEVGEWVLLDFGDVVLHVMSEEQRERYKLEEFWSRPHPDGEMPPTPGTVLGEGGEGDDSDLDAVDLDDEDLDDAAFFEDADTEVEPIDEDEVENEDGQFDDFGDAPPGRQSRKGNNNGTGGSGGGGR